MLSIYDFLLLPPPRFNEFILLAAVWGSRVSSVPWSRHLNHSRNCSKIENFCKQTDNTSEHTHTFVFSVCVCVFIYMYIYLVFVYAFNSLDIAAAAVGQTRQSPSPTPSLFPLQLHFQPDSHSQRDFDLFVGFAMRKWN